MAKRNHKKKTTKKIGGKARSGSSGGGGKDGDGDVTGKEEAQVAKKTDLLCQRQQPRNLQVQELLEAMEKGEMVVDREDGTIRYSYEGVVNVTTPDGVGITVFRLEPLQCICGDPSEHSNDDDFDYYMRLSDGRKNKSRLQVALERISVGIIKANVMGANTPRSVSGHRVQSTVQ